MLSRPNYCCNCGERIERIEWHLWTSRRFCELCQTDRQVDDWLPRIFGTVLFVTGLSGFAASYRDACEPPDLIVSPVALAKHRAERIKVFANSSGEEPGEASADARDVPDAPREPRLRNTEAVEASSTVEAQVGSPRLGTAPVSVYICGAETKKGTACTRRVKGAGRCWQHKGREAMLPPDELVVDDGD